jgi:hypothetical protein
MAHPVCRDCDRPPAKGRFLCHRHDALEELARLRSLLSRTSDALLLPGVHDTTAEAVAAAARTTITALSRVAYAVGVRGVA